MSDRPNLFEPDFDSESEAPGFANRRARLGRQAGSERLGLSLFELEPGCAAFPLHYHLGNEELLIALTGGAALRIPEGERELEPGEVVALTVGEGGAHQVVNRSTEPVRFAIVSEMNAPDIVVRPESNKLSAFGRAPGAAGAGLHDAYFRRDAVDLWEGEEPPPSPSR